MTEPTLYQRCAHYGDLRMQSIHDCDGYMPVEPYGCRCGYRRCWARPVEPDYEAAARELHEQSVSGEDTYEAAKAVVDAALGIGGDEDE